MFKTVNQRLRLISLLAVGVFTFVTLMGYIPPFLDENGFVFGLFKLDIWDDALHATSALWAVFAAWKVGKQAIFYFIGFGAYYLFDAYFHLMKWGLDTTNILVNTPHLILGVLGMLIGYYYGVRYLQLKD